MSSHFVPPAVPQLAEKVSVVMTLLSTHDLVEGSQRKILAARITDFRAAIGKGGEMYEGNLADYLNGKKPLPKTFLDDLTNSLGLIELGFDQTIWFEPLDDLVDQVKLALEGGVVSTVFNHGNSHSLLILNPAVEMGIHFKKRRKRLKGLPPIPEVVVRSGSVIETALHLAKKSYVRVIACEEGEFIGMNEILNIPRDQVPDGKRPCGPIPVLKGVSFTLIYAFATTQPHFRGWPVDEQEGTSLSHGQFLKLVKNFYALPESERVSSVQAFITAELPPLSA